ncbi:MAG: hypothetical protein ACLUNO_10200 [Oscillospiraceae bacterium]
MSTGQYLLGGAAGLVFGLLVAAGNTLLTRRSLLRAKQNAASVMGTSGLRQVINLAALVLVYLLRGVVPLPLAGTLIGTAVGLSGGSIAGVWILARKMDDTIPAECVEITDADELPDAEQEPDAGARSGGRTEGRHKWVKRTYCFPSDRWRSPARS